MFDKQTLDIPCPHCGQKTPKTVAWLKTKTDFPCLACGGIVAVDATDLTAKLKQADKIIAKFGKSFGKL